MISEWSESGVWIARWGATVIFLGSHAWLQVWSLIFLSALSEVMVKWSFSTVGSLGTEKDLFLKLQYSLARLGRAFFTSSALVLKMFMWLERDVFTRIEPSEGEDRSEKRGFKNNEEQINQTYLQGLLLGYSLIDTYPLIFSSKLWLLWWSLPCVTQQTCKTLQCAMVHIVLRTLFCFSAVTALLDTQIL